MYVERVRTADGRAAALAVRHAVFTAEQGIDPSADRDGRDGAATHTIGVVETAETDEWSVPDVTVDGNPAQAGGETERVVGTVRFREAAEHVRGERLAVLPGYRGEGVGSALVTRLLREAAASGADRVLVHAQADNVPFCRSHGFRETGERFEEVGIEHAEMVHPLTDVAALGE